MGRKQDSSGKSGSPGKQNPSRKNDSPRKKDSPKTEASSKTKASPNGNSGGELTAGKRRVFMAVTVALPFVLLLAAEGALRLAGVGSTEPLFIEADSAGTYLRMNPSVSERYFYGDFTAPGATYDPFRKWKKQETYRIVVQGGSTALGFPYFYGATFPRMLEWRLQETFPQKDIEVINTALTAVNSHTLLDFADEIIEQKPDAVLIYAGHNEYYGVFGVASTRAGGNTRWVATYLRLRRLRLVQLMSRALAWLGGGQSEPADQTGGTVMAKMVGERVIPLGSRLYQAGLEQFERNMDELLRRYHEAGIPVYIATVVSNERDQPPFISESDSSVSPAEWDEDLAAAQRYLSQNKPGEAVAPFRELETRDSLDAGAFYRTARVFDSAGAHPEARELYRAAKERDLLRFRAPEAINRIVREEADRYGDVVVDVQQAFVNSSPDSIVDHSLITEHLHPTIDGYFVMADAFYDALREQHAIGSWGNALPRDEARRGVPVTAVDSLYGTLLLESLTSGWPFQDDPAIERRTAEDLRTRQGANTVEAIALQLFRREVSWPEAMLELFDYYMTEGPRGKAGRVARALAQERPLAGLSFELLAQLAIDADSLDQAEHWLGRAWEVEPNPRTAVLLGSVLLRQGKQEEALAALQRGVNIAPPGVSEPRTVLSSAQSLPQLKREVEESPRDADALYNLALAYAITNLTDQARATLERLMEVEPDSERGASLLRQVGVASDSSVPLPPSSAPSVP